MNQWSVVHGVPAEQGRFSYIEDVAALAAELGFGWTVRMGWERWRGGRAPAALLRAQQVAPTHQRQHLPRHSGFLGGEAATTGRSGARSSRFCSRMEQWRMTRLPSRPWHLTWGNRSGSCVAANSVRSECSGRREGAAAYATRARTKRAGQARELRCARGR